MATQHTRSIAIDDLVVGMYIVGLDRPWLQSPFLLPRRRIGCGAEIARLKAYGVRQVTIDLSRGLDRLEPLALSSAMGSPSPAHVQSPEPPHAAPTAEPAPAPHPVSPMPDLPLARAVHTEAATAVQSLFDGVLTGTPLNSDTAQQVVHRLMETVLHHPAALTGLIHMRQFDASLYTHATNVCVLALLLGTAQRLDQTTLVRLGMGALLHDVGQVHLPRNLIRKPGLYTAQEQRLMQKHPQLGATMLSRSIHEDACRIITEHHERLDGSGYPRGLGGVALSPLSQMVAIADSYEAMLGHREGRPPLLPARAVKELYQQGRAQQFDLGLVEKMVRCLGIYPVGSLVELSTAERGLVIAVNPTNALRPVVHILWDPTGQLYTTPRTVDLANAPVQAIHRVLDPATEGYDIPPMLREVPVSHD